MTSRRGRLSILVLTLTLGACTTAGGAPSSDATQPPVAIQPAPVILQPTAVVATPTPGPTASPAPSPSDGAVAAGQPTPGPIDPCTLLKTDEASQLIGVKLAAGVSTTLDHDRVCTFKKGTTEVKVILAPPVLDSAAANAYWDAERAKFPAHLPVTDLSLFDRSAYGSGAALGVSVSAIFVLDGQSFFDLYCGFPACTQDASVAAAELIAGRLP